MVKIKFLFVCLSYRFDIRLMREGRMKGQAFVTLPGTEQAKQAVADVNAFVLKGKPMAVVSSRRIHVISFVFSSSVHHSVYLLLHLSFLIFFRWVFFFPSTLGVLRVCVWWGGDKNERCICVSTGV